VKTIRVIISIIIAFVALSSWPPATASAQMENTQITTAPALNGSDELPKVAFVIIENKTGGILYVELKAMQYAHEPRRRSYNLAFFESGKIRFQILPGRYTYTIRSSNCGGQRINTKFFTGETTIGIYTCDKKSK